MSARRMKTGENESFLPCSTPWWCRSAECTFHRQVFPDGAYIPSYTPDVYEWHDGAPGLEAPLFAFMRADLIVFRIHLRVQWSIGHREWGSIYLDKFVHTFLSLSLSPSLLLSCSITKWLVRLKYFKRNLILYSPDMVTVNNWQI